MTGEALVAELHAARKEGRPPRPPAPVGANRDEGLTMQLAVHTSPARIGGRFAANAIKPIPTAIQPRPLDAAGGNDDKGVGLVACSATERDAGHQRLATMAVTRVPMESSQRIVLRPIAANCPLTTAKPAPSSAAWLQSRRFCDKRRLVSSGKMNAAEMTMSTAR